MAKSTTSRKKSKKGEQTFGKLLAGATLTLILLYFVQSALLVAEKQPLDTAITSYKQQRLLDSNH